MKVGDLVRCKKEKYCVGIIIGWNNRDRGVIPLVQWADPPAQNYYEGDGEDCARPNPSLIRQRKLEVINE